MSFTDYIKELNEKYPEIEIIGVDARPLDDVFVSVSDGILFFIAFWSGESRIRIKTLRDILIKYNIKRLYIKDIDDIETEHSLYVKRYSFGGYGETFWMENGGVVHSIIKCDTKDYRILTECFSRSTVKVIKWCQWSEFSAIMVVFNVTLLALPMLTIYMLIFMELGLEPKDLIIMATSSVVVTILLDVLIARRFPVVYSLKNQDFSVHLIYGVKKYKVSDFEALRGRFLVARDGRRYIIDNKEASVVLAHEIDESPSFQKVD